MTEEAPTIKLGGIEVRDGDKEDIKLSMLIWGPAGCGKTTLAWTAPGKKLWLLFDPKGTASLRGLDNYVVADFTTLKPEQLMDKFRKDESLGLAKFIADNAIDTVVVDSLTAFSQAALESHVGKERNSTIEKPGISSYGARNALTLRMIQAVLRETGRANCHVIFISHEAEPVTNDDGLVLYITMQLGGQLPNQTALQLSEVWFMQDTEKGRRIAVRPCRSRKPMKTRAIDASSSPEFIWKYDASKPDSKHTIEHWYNEWIRTGKKIPLPG